MNAPISSSSPSGPTRTSSSSSASSEHQSPVAAIRPPQPMEVKTPSTDPFLKDLNLVAEAAKRAQMAVMMRDFEGCGLS